MNNINDIFDDLNSNIINTNNAIYNLRDSMMEINNINFDLIIESIDKMSLSIINLNDNQFSSMSISKLLAETLIIISTAFAVAEIAADAFGKTLALNPLTFAILAVASLATAFFSLTASTNNQTDAALSLSEATKTAVDEQQKMVDAANETASKSSLEMDYYISLAKELDSLVDANGRVTDANKERANFIANTLSNVTGEEIKLTDGIIENYDGMKDKIKELIEQKKAKAILDAHEKDYINAIQQQEIAYSNLIKTQSDLKEYEENRGSYIEDYKEKLKELYRTEEELEKAANYAYESTLKTKKKAFEEQNKAYEGFSKQVNDYEQATSDYLSGSYDDISKTIAGTNEAYMTNSKERKLQIEKDIDEEIFALEQLNGKKGKMSEEQYEKEKEDIIKSLNNKQAMLFEMNNAVLENTDAYSEAMAFLSNLGLEAYDENGNLTEATLLKLDGILLKVYENNPLYTTALTDLANAGQVAFDQNGMLTEAAQKKLTDTFIKMYEIDPEYSKILTQMANDGKAVFNAKGDLTADAQKKLIDAYAGMNNLTPEYKQKLLDMVNGGQAVFDANGNLSSAAVKKLESAKKAVEDNKSTYTTSLKKTAEDGAKEIEDADTYSAGLSFISGAALGIAQNSNLFLNSVGGVAAGGLGIIHSMWKVNSPSKKTRDLAASFMEGLYLGIDMNKSRFVNSVDDVASEALNRIQASFQGIDTKNLFRQMQSTINSENLRMQGLVNSNITHTMFNCGKLQVEVPEFKGTIHGNIENHVMMDGRETAIQLTPFISEELAFSAR